MKKNLIYSFLVTLIVWLIFVWPLPLHLTTTIPAGASKPAPETTIERMIPGDHLQLLYHFWLFSDMIRGKTPLFHNLYEFNTGNDAERHEVGSYYLPFSFFYSVGDWIATPALGWNLASFLSLWFTYFFTWQFLRRYTSDTITAAVVSLISITIPFRWITLAGGSPTGFTMMWIPALLYGIDRAVRDDKWTGGLLAGTAILFSAWGDPHVFFFAGLVTPCWCIFAFLARDKFEWKNIHAYLRIAVALLPIAVLGLLGFLSSKTTSRHMETASSAGGRRISEIALYSPEPEGLFSQRELEVHNHVSNHIYIGYIIVVLLLIGLLALLAKRNRKQIFLYLLLLLGMFGIICLALGPVGFFDGRPFTAARKFIPHYDMIRQPTKVFCLFPTFLTVAVVMALNAIGPGTKKIRWISTLFILAIFVEYKMQHQPVLSVMDNHQEAYHAVAQDAASPTPRVLILPIWPGDSHYGSIYEYYVALYRIRMMNGYRPMVAQEYIDTIFKYFESANLGILSDEQLDNLQSRDIHHLIFHEDLFPEKVSPFPVAFTLKNLLNHPRLTFIKQDAATWAFRILEQPAEKPKSGESWSYLFPTRHFEVEKARIFDATIVTNVDATFVRFNKAGAHVFSRTIHASPAPDLRWMARLRGTGTLSVAEQTIEIDESDWNWKSIPISSIPTNLLITFSNTLLKGTIDLDRVYLAAGPSLEFQAGQSITIPAPCFFHAGHIDLPTDSVILRATETRKDLIFYGPKLPVDKGAYEMSINYESPAEKGTVLGMWIIACPEGDEIGRFDFVAGQEAKSSFTISNDVPLLIALNFFKTGDVTLKELTITKLK